MTLRLTYCNKKELKANCKQFNYHCIEQNKANDTIVKSFLFEFFFHKYSSLLLVLKHFNKMSLRDDNIPLADDDPQGICLCSNRFWEDDDSYLPTH